MDYATNLKHTATILAEAHFKDEPGLLNDPAVKDTCVELFTKVAAESINRERLRAIDAYRMAAQWSGMSVTNQEIERDYLEPQGLIPPKSVEV